MGGGDAPLAYRKNHLIIRLPDGQKRLDEFSDRRSQKHLVKNKAEKIRQMISSSHPGEIGVVFLNAGQGDATILRLPNGKVMVIDCNIDNSPENIVDYLKDAGIKRIDYLVITHPHYDHMSGTKEIADNFEVGEVWTTDYKRKKAEESPESYEAYKDAYVKGLNKLEKKGAKIKKPMASNNPLVKDGELEIKALGPSSYIQGNNEDIHEESLVIQIRVGKTTAVFAGDTTNSQQDRICKYYPVKGTTIWHASHHGSVEGANEEVMREVRPKYTVIPVGKGNNHGHPNKDAMNTYNKYTQKKVYRTDKGNIGFEFNSKGDGIEIQE
jgi:competence protein ComEC